MLRRLASLPLCTTLAIALALPLPARASVWSVAAVATADDPAAVLGLESDDAAAGDALTKALRKAFAKRGLGGGQDMSLVELRLTMGCSGDDAKCLAEGGKSIEVRRLIYGSLKKTGSGGYMLRLNMLEVSSASLEKETSRPLSAADLSKDKIEATAAAIVQSMLPEETSDEPPIEPGTEPGTEPSREPRTSPTKPTPRDKKYIWGLDKPVPKWKAIGLGVSAGMFVISLGAAIGLTVATKKTLRDKLVDTANESLTDRYPEGTPNAGQLNKINDVDPTTVNDICSYARQHPPEDTSNPGSVRNKKVTEVCNVADGVQKGQFAAWAATAVFGVSTIVFTVLMFVRKNDSAAAAAAYRHGVRFGATPTRGGMTFGAGFKF